MGLCYVLSLSHSRMWNFPSDPQLKRVMVGILLISVHFSLISGLGNSGLGNTGLGNADIILTVEVKLKQNRITLTRTEAECRQSLMLTMIAAYSFSICHLLIMLLLGASQWQEEEKSFQFCCPVTNVLQCGHYNIILSFNNSVLLSAMTNTVSSTSFGKCFKHTLSLSLFQSTHISSWYRLRVSCYETMCGPLVTWSGYTPIRTALSTAQVRVNDDVSS